jgi:CheY-like chemotaxis protein/nitrogen-specific signal transduction histidine kinase
MSMRRVTRAKAAPKKRLKRTRSRRAGARVDPIEAALAMLAHEIRTPLNGILALSELIAAAALPEREREWAGLVKSAAEHLANFTTLVVDGVRAEARGIALREEPFRPRALAEAVGGTLAARAEAKGLGANIVIAADLPELLSGDRVRLRAALENLADNAVKFTESGHVSFSVASAPARGRHRLTFTITDSGVGLTRAEIAKLFRPFAQANSAVGGRFGGAGLGLVFVKRLAEAMKGKLTVESKAGRGSTFRLAVTLAPAAAMPAATQQRVAGPRSLRVLCAEDNPYARVVLNTILTELGHRTDFAGSGEAAIAAVERGDYDLVLMDVSLPGLDGLSAARAIRALAGAAARVRIIGVSGRSEPADVEAALAAGMNAFLGKPVSPATLAKALASSFPLPAERGEGAEDRRSEAGEGRSPQTPRPLKMPLTPPSPRKGGERE